MQRARAGLGVVLACALAAGGWPSRAGAQPEGPMTSLDERANGDTVTITPGARLVLALPENPTTGYRWRLLAAGAPVLQLLDQGFTPGPPRPGAGGTHHWAWQAAQPGEAALRLDHARSWGEEPPVRQFTLTVRVGG